jgi:hypothetical protein
VPVIVSLLAANQNLYLLSFSKLQHLDSVTSPLEGDQEDPKKTVRRHLCGGLEEGLTI